MVSVLSGDFWNRYTKAVIPSHQDSMRDFEQSKKVLREKTRQLAEHRRKLRRLWHRFQMGELRAKAGLPPAPERDWSTEDEAAYCRGYKHGRSG